MTHLLPRCLPAAGLLALFAVLLAIVMDLADHALRIAAGRPDEGTHLLCQLPPLHHAHVFFAVLLPLGVRAASFDKADVIFLLNGNWGKESATRVHQTLLSLCTICQNNELFPQNLQKTARIRL